MIFQSPESSAQNLEFFDSIIFDRQWQKIEETFTEKPILTEPTFTGFSNHFFIEEWQRSGNIVVNLYTAEVLPIEAARAKKISFND